MASDVIKCKEEGESCMFEENVPPDSMREPVKRLTKVEQARLEALSSFGNCPFNSLFVKKDSFKAKLNATFTATGKNMTKRLTRMQKAKLEANEAFKNISLGQKRKAIVVQRKREMSPLAATAKRRLTRLDKCKLEVQNAFGNVALSEINGNVDMQQDQNSCTETMAKNSGTTNIGSSKTDVTSIGRGSLEKTIKGRRKSTSKGMTNRRSTSRRRSSAAMRRKSSTKVKRLTRVQAARLEVLQSFGGQSLDDVWKPCKNELPSCTKVTEQVISDKKKNENESVGAKGEIQMTDNDECHTVSEAVTQADSMEDGNKVASDVYNTCQQVTDMVDEAVPKENSANSPSRPCCQVVNESTQVYEPFDEDKRVEHCNQSKAITSEFQVQSQDSFKPTHDQSCDAITGTNGMRQIPAEQSLHQSFGQSNNVQTSNMSFVEPRPLTRLERARLEAIQSFHGEAFEKTMKSSSRKMAKYLTPVKHRGTNTEANPTSNTPSQTEDSYCRRYPRPKSSFYTNLRENSFFNRDALLESSKMVVLTARSLDTPSPHCSPTDAVNP